MIRRVTNLLRGLLIAAIAFAVGSIAGSSAYVHTSLAEITQNPSAFNGKLVEVETFAQLDLVFDKEWTLGEPFEKREVFTFLELSNTPRSLRERLAADITEDKYNRVRVIARGRLRDNCETDSGIITCCFGTSITLQEAEITPIAPVERYTRPKQ